MSKTIGTIEEMASVQEAAKKLKFSFQVNN